MVWEQLRGFNLGTAEIPPHGMDDYKSFSGTGAKLLRVPIQCYQQGSASNYRLTPLQWSFLETTVSLGRRWGFKIVLVMAPQPGGIQAQYWKDSTQQQGIAQLWAQIAAHFKGDEIIAGFDLLNEPVAPTPEEWLRFASMLTSAIRVQDPVRTVIVEPSQWGHALGFNTQELLPFEDIVYSFHFYDPLPLTHQGIMGGCPVGQEYPTQHYTKDFLAAQIQPAVDFSNTHKVPMYVGEFGCARWAPGNSRQDWIKDAAELFEAQEWAWTYLAWRGFDGFTAELPNGLPVALPQPAPDYYTLNSEAYLALKDYLK